MSFNNFEASYDAKAKDWQKSVSEISKFFLDNSRDYFIVEKKEFDNDEEGKLAKARAERLQARLAELVEKSTKRLGYKIDAKKLVYDAYRHILALNDSGELPPSNLLQNFCAEISERLEDAA